jgi:hypothetical protein
MLGDAPPAFIRGQVFSSECRDHHHTEPVFLRFYVQLATVVPGSSSRLESLCLRALSSASCAADNRRRVRHDHPGGHAAVWAGCVSRRQRAILSMCRRIINSASKRPERVSGMQPMPARHKLLYKTCPCSSFRSFDTCTYYYVYLFRSVHVHVYVVLR